MKIIEEKNEKIKRCSLCNSPVFEGLYCALCTISIREQAMCYSLVGDVLSGRVYEYGGGKLC